MDIVLQIKYKIKHANPFILIIMLMFLTLLLSQKEPENEEEINLSPKRVVSLSPSITRQIIDLESEELLVGVTSYHPPLSRKIAIIGNLIQPNIEKIFILDPDIVFLSKEDNPIQNIEKIGLTGIKTYTFNRNSNLDDLFRNYLELAKLINKKDCAERKISDYRSILETYRSNAKEYKAAFFISLDPLIASSNSSFIGGIIEDAGGRNVFREMEMPYPKISIEFLVGLNPDIIVSIMPDAEKFFKCILDDFKDINAMKYNNIYYIKPEKICYYSPKDYIESVGIISDLIKMMNLKRDEE